MHTYRISKENIVYVSPNPNASTTISAIGLIGSCYTTITVTEDMIQGSNRATLML